VVLLALSFLGKTCLEAGGLEAAGIEEAVLEAIG
jgi:hypothetical protein